MKSVCAVLYDNNKFLILHRKLKWIGWEFVKGRVEKNEDEKTALLREIKEETNLEVDIVKKLAIENIYSNSQKVRQQVFLVKYKKGEIKLSEEHDDFKWVSFETALKLLTYDNQKKSLVIAKKYLT